MADICPTITAFNEKDYKKQIDQIIEFAPRVHIDLTDGVFAPSQTVKPAEIWWPARIKADVHLMHDHPETRIEPLLNLRPDLVIIHAEAKGDLNQALAELKQAGLKCGVALLAKTSTSTAKALIEQVDHVLIFSGNLGYQGGSQVDLELLDKVKQVKDINPNAEIGWDGGVNDQNISEIVDAGVDVINVGGYIQNADSPRDAYAILKARIRRP